MNSIIHGNLRIDLIDEHGALIRRTTTVVKAPALHPRLDGAPPQPRAGLVGRATEVAAAGEAAPGYPVEFVAPCGYGKSSLLRQVTARHASAGTPVVYLNASGDVEDVRQQLFERCYRVTNPLKPVAQEYAELLAQLRGVVVLDDLTSDHAQTRQLVAGLPRCAVIIGSSRRTLSGIGRSLSLTGLSDDAAVQLLRAELGRDLTGAERADALRLCEAVDYQPLHLRQAAALARHGHALSQLAQLASNDPRNLDRLSVDGLAIGQRRILAVCALAAGALLPAGIVQSALDLADVWSTLTGLHQRGLLERDGDRFGLPVCHKEQYRKLLVDNVELGQAVRGIADWLSSQDPTGDDARAAAQAALTVIGYAAERGEWSSVRRLVEAAEQVLCLAGRWDAWRRVLEHGIHAARALGDPATQAYLVHQLGVLEFSTDQLELAASHWRDAQQMREDLHDQAGVERSQANLDLLAPVPAGPTHQQTGRPDASRPRGRRARRAAWAAVVIVLLLALGYPVVRSAAARVSSAAPATQATVGAGATAATTTAPGPASTSSPRSVASGSVVPTVTVLNPISNPATYRGACPATITFTATIRSSGGPVQVTYTWVRSDGASGPTQTITLGGRDPDARTVQDTWQLGGQYSGWEALRLLAPQQTTSRPADFTLNCTAPPRAVVDKVELPPATTWCAYDKVVFDATVTVDQGPVEVAYRWVFADGTATPILTISFAGAGQQSKTIQSSWAPKTTDVDSYPGWAAIEISQPVKATSDRAVFTLKCMHTPG